MIRFFLSLILEKKKESSSTSDKKKKTTSTKSGSQACNISNGGYDSIYTSGTTGRQFKEFKQNSGSFRVWLLLKV